MKNILICAALVCWHLSYAQKRDYKNPVADIKDYRFEIDLNDDNDTINCLAVIHLLSLKASGSLLIDLVSVKDNGKGMRALEVKENGQSLHYTHVNDLLQINSPFGAGEEKTISIRYKGIPADGLIISKNKYGRRTFFSDNWPNRGHNWLACIDHPSDKAAVDFIVRAPAHYQVVSNGILLEETNLSDKIKLTHWRETNDLPVKVMAIGVAAFAVQYQGAAQNDSFPVNIYSWVYPENRQNGFADYSVAADILPYYINRIGPFPYKKLANVQSKTIFGGMENAGAIFYDESTVTGKGKTEKLIAHEIVHQWFGDMATEADWPHIWLSEGFAAYLSLLYLENKYGTDTLKSELARGRRQVIDFSRKRFRPIVDTAVTDYMELLNPNTYQKGAWVLHMLRKQLGDSVFWEGIRKYYSAYAGKNAVTSDLIKVMESVSGKDLQVFFSQWLERAGYPKLNIRWKYDAVNKQALITVIQEQTGPLFQFPLTILFEGKGGPIYKTTFIKERQTVYTVPMKMPPAKAVIDPDVSLLYE